MTNGVRRLTHEEAEMLISARMDEHLDRADSRALLVHLQTCERCRAFAVQTEILGRELEALPMLPASAMVDRRIRETITAKKRPWSFAGFFPAGSGSGGLRAAAGALAVLALVSVYLLIRMAGSGTGNSRSIDAPNGAVAQQIERTATVGGALGAVPATGPTETPRVVAPPTQPAGEDRTVESAQIDNTSTASTIQNTLPPTATLDPTYGYAIDRTPTPVSVSNTATSTSESLPVTEESGVVVAAAVGGMTSPEPAPPVSESTAIPATPIIPTEPPKPAENPQSAATPATPGGSPAQMDDADLTVEPTMTPTPVEISVAASEATQESSEQSMDRSASESTPDEASSSSSPIIEETDESIVATPTAQSSGPTATPETPSEETPFAQPTIAPLSGDRASSTGNNDSTGNDHAEQDHENKDSHDGDHSPPIEPSDDAGVQTASIGDGSGGSPQIVSTNGDVASDATESNDNNQPTANESGVGGENANASPTQEITTEPTGLDLSPAVTTLPAGTSSPVGRLEFSPTLDFFAIIAPDGQLAVADENGELVVMLGSGDLPVWSGTAMMFRTPGENGSVVGIWNSDSAELAYIPASEDEISDDLPIGGSGTSFYFLRSFPDRPGALEIHNATIDGADEGIIWSSDSIVLGGARPVWSANGILLPTDSIWLLIDSDGNETELGQNPYGFLGAPVLSPGEGLMAYSAGDQVVVAWTEDPGTAVATAPFGEGTGGYAFSPSGEEIVVSDGAALHVVSYEGDDLGSTSGTRPIGGVSWPGEAIFFLQTGEDAAVRSITLQEIQDS